VNPAARGHFSGYVCLLKNFSGTPAAIFVDAHQYRKINKSRRADSSEADGDIDSESKWLLHLSDVSRLQPSLLWFRLMWLRAFQF
jgi:hypothetical protein